MFLGYVLHKLNQFVFKEFVLYVFWKMFHFCCMFRWQSLIEEIRAVSNIGQKGQFFGKKDTKNLSIPYSIPFLSVLHKNKALHNFHKRGQCLITGLINCYTFYSELREFLLNFDGTMACNGYWPAFFFFFPAWLFELIGSELVLIESLVRRHYSSLCGGGTFLRKSTCDSSGFIPLVDITGPAKGISSKLIVHFSWFNINPNSSVFLQ